MAELNLLKKQLNPTQIELSSDTSLYSSCEWVTTKKRQVEEGWQMTPNEEMGLLGFLFLGSSLRIKDRVFLETEYTFESGNLISINLNVNEEIKIPRELNNIYEAVEKSRYILDLKDNWDDEGSIGYQTETWKRAIEFIVNYSKEIYEKFSKIISAPEIFHSVNGSIDLLWKSKNYQLLVNVPPGEGPARFYGDNFGIDKIEGEFDPKNYKLGLILALIDQGNVAS